MNNHIIFEQRVEELKAFRFKSEELYQNFWKTVINELYEILNYGKMPEDKWQEFFLEQLISFTSETYETTEKQFLIPILQEAINDVIVILRPIKSFLMKINFVDVAIKTNSKVVEIVNIDKECDYGTNCNRPGCWYKHTKTEIVKNCRFGNYCTRSGCWHIHPKQSESSEER